MERRDMRGTRGRGGGPQTLSLLVVQLFIRFSSFLFISFPNALHNSFQKIVDPNSSTHPATVSCFCEFTHLFAIAQTGPYLHLHNTDPQ
jgi:hypothetical protein